MQNIGHKSVRNSDGTAAESPVHSLPTCLACRDISKVIQTEIAATRKTANSERQSRSHSLALRAVRDEALLRSAEKRTVCLLQYTSPSCSELTGRLPKLC